jgi:hypothetical protein
VRLSRSLSYVAAGLLLLASCAVREEPKGGPEDKTPPSIITIDPPEGSINIPVNSSFAVTFSKSMKKTETESAVFLSPVFWRYPRLRWSGKRLTVIPPEDLKANTTYILTIGAGATGIHGNRLGQSQSFAFSTGPVIDSGTISGAVFSADGQHPLYDIWAYALGDTGVTDFWRGIPDYATQVDSLGEFRIEHLGANRYFIIAISDKNDDLFWDPSSEDIGLPPGVIRLEKEGQAGGVVFQPSRRDTSLAYITRANPLSQQRLSVEFSSQPDRERELNSDSYRIEYGDSLLNFATPYLGEGGALILETDRQQAGVSYRLVPVDLVNTWGVPFDTAGVRFTGIDAPDTIGPKLLSNFPSNGSNSIYEDSVIEMTFSKRILSSTFTSAVNVVADSTDTLQFHPVWIAPNQVRLRFSAGIPRQRKINVTLSPERITDIFQNRIPDSSLGFSFRLPPADTVGSVTVTTDSGQTNNMIGMLTQYGRGGDTYKGRFDSQGKLTLNSIMPGVYRFEFFADSDSNGEWSPGAISPFNPAERFSFLADSVKVRSRWSTDIGAVSLPNPAP